MSSRFRLLPALLLLLAAGCVSTTYERGQASGRGATPPILVEISEDGGLSAFGRDFRDVRSLARALRDHGASARQKGGPETVILRCGEGTSLSAARAVREGLVRNGVPAVTIRGPRSVSTSLAPDKGY